MPKEAPAKRRSTVGRRNSPAVVHGPSCLCYTCVHRAREAKRLSTSVDSVQHYSQVNTVHSGFSSPDEDAEEGVRIPRQRGKASRARVDTTLSDSMNRPHSPLYSFDTERPQEEEGTSYASPSGSECEGPFNVQNASSATLPLTEDSTPVRGGAAIVEAWNIIQRRGDASLLQQTVPTAMESLWNPAAVTSTGSKPTLEWFQRFADRLPAMMKDRHHQSPHFALSATSALRMIRPSNEPLTLGVVQSIGERHVNTFQVPALAMRNLDQNMRRQAHVANMSRLLQQTLHYMVTSSADWTQQDQEDLVGISLALDELTREGVSLAAFALTNAHLIKRHTALLSMSLPAQVHEDCLTSAFTAHSLFGPEAAVSMQRFNESHLGANRAPRRRSRSHRGGLNQPPQTATSTSTGDLSTRGNFGSRGRRASSGRGSRAARRPYSRTSGRGQYS
eukprot:TRINITY_DN24252_c0_g1_i1.p1 TRINITY_DN24252_c0_g1~~TRINITY_DN24252_c0_g1_i1.p1  ORF type:complete len:447 (-),score=20.54 TRINITY_DN24252_c0_g1_i1:49-1389(-)